MKVFIYILMVAGVALLIFNATKIDFSAPFSGDSAVAAACILAAACAVLLLYILLLSKKVSQKRKNR